MRNLRDETPVFQLTLAVSNIKEKGIKEKATLFQQKNSAPQKA